LTTHPTKFNTIIEENGNNIKFENSELPSGERNRMNFLCGPGVFDWSDSRLIQDVKHGKKEFMVASA